VTEAEAELELAREAEVKDLLTVAAATGACEYREMRGGTKLNEE
jgi:hypothetical protein